jgi:predicted  nucleic acid-binding Zn-ribbon protein
LSGAVVAQWILSRNALKRSKKVDRAAIFSRPLTWVSLPDNLREVQMLEAIEKLLILQDRDRTIARLRTELANVDPERQALQAKTAASQAALDAARQRIKQIESDRKKLELEVDSKKQAIERYSLQQFQTKKNDEYRALAHEIQMAREAIFKLEDQQLELMEKAESAQRELAAATRVAEEARTQADRQIADLTSREKNLKNELGTLEADRDQLASAVDPAVLPRYERLRKSKGDNVVVGVAHGVCGGCHMKLQRQVIVTCQGHQDIVACPNCGRILYYTRDMSLVAAE